MVHCQQLAADTIEVTDPIVVYEVLSPDSVERDHGEKVDGYFSVAPLQHYLIIDPDRHTVIHHHRGSGEDLITRIIKVGEVVLDPPDLTLSIAELFG